MTTTTKLSVMLGIDIGGTGIKGAPVSLETGTLLAEKLRIPTPEPATPHAVGDVVKKLVERFNWSGAIGCSKNPEYSQNFLLDSHDVLLLFL